MIAAGIAARERYLAALRGHEADLEDKLRAGKGDYWLLGIIVRLRRCIEDEAYLTQRDMAEEYAA